jgi:hypothetical protein
LMWQAGPAQNTSKPSGMCDGLIYLFFDEDY